MQRLGGSSSFLPFASARSDGVVRAPVSAACVWAPRTPLGMLTTRSAPRACTAATLGPPTSLTLQEFPPFGRFGKAFIMFSVRLAGPAARPRVGLLPLGSSYPLNSPFALLSAALQIELSPWDVRTLLSAQAAPPRNEYFRQDFSIIQCGGAGRDWLDPPDLPPSTGRTRMSVPPTAPGAGDTRVSVYHPSR